MTTIADLVADARRMTYGAMTEQINVISANAAAGADMAAAATLTAA